MLRQKSQPCFESWPINSKLWQTFPRAHLAGFPSMLRPTYHSDAREYTHQEHALANFFKSSFGGIQIFAANLFDANPSLELARTPSKQLPNTTRQARIEAHIQYIQTNMFITNILLETRHSIAKTTFAVDFVCPDTLAANIWIWKAYFAIKIQPCAQF